jgi:hypothetical protein
MVCCLDACQNLEVCGNKHGQSDGDEGRLLLRFVLCITLLFNTAVWAFVWKLVDNLKVIENFVDTWPATLCVLLAEPNTEVVEATDQYRISVEVMYTLLNGESMQSVAYNSYDERFRSFQDKKYLEKYEAVWAGDKTTECFYNPQDPGQVILEHQSDNLTTNQSRFAIMAGLIGGSIGLCCFGFYCFLLRDSMRSYNDPCDDEAPSELELPASSTISQPPPARSTLSPEDMHANPIYKSNPDLLSRTRGSKMLDDQV